jgi:hypothetical protein
MLPKDTLFFNHLIRGRCPSIDFSSIEVGVIVKTSMSKMSDGGSFIGSGVCCTVLETLMA